MQDRVPKSNKFSKSALHNLVAFSEVLRRVHARLLAEGYIIQIGSIVKEDAKITGEAIIKENEDGAI